MLGWTFVCVITSLLFMLWGYFNSAPGAFRVGTVYVVWPLLFIFFIGVFHHLRFWKPYLKVMVLASLAVEAFCLLLITDAVGLSNFGVKEYLSLCI